jgi:hypothetical protein
MLERSNPPWFPLWLRQAAAIRARGPGARGFAVLAGIEAVIRGILVTVMPLSMYHAFPDTRLVSEIYFGIGVVSLLAGLMVPALTRIVPRRWAFTAGALLFVGGNILAILGGPLVALGLLCNTVATVTVFICLNAYLLDYIAKGELVRAESLRMFYSAMAWTLGPVAGVWIMEIWRPAPFLVSLVAALLLLVVFWVMRLGNGKLIAPARGPALNPLAYLGRFFRQPRLIAGWLFAVLKSCGWWVYIVYLPIFAVESGLGDKVAGLMLSLSNALLFATPVMLRWMQRRAVRAAVRLGFLAAGTTFILATFASLLPPLALVLLFLGSVFLILLDISAGLPFLLAVRPLQRTEMSAVYSTFRDVSGMVTPGVAWLVLLVSPLAGVFAAAGLMLLGGWAMAGRLHPQLGIAAARRIAARRARLS